MQLKRIDSVLVTGGAGFIGSHVVEQLVQRGKRVLAVDNLSTGVVENLAAVADQVDFVEGSVADDSLIDELVCRADAVIHLAASVGNRLVARRPLESIENNLRGTSRLLSACAKYQRPVLLASSSEVYGRSKELPFKEDGDLVLGRSTSPRWLYAVSKLTNEFEAMAYHRQNQLPAVVMRFFNIAGPRQRGRYGMVLPRFVKQALAGEPLSVYGQGDQLRCFCHVVELSEVVIRLMETPEAYGRIVNLGSGNLTTIAKLAELVIERTGSSSKIEHVPYESVYGPDYDDMARRQPDTSVARELTGFDAKRTLADIVDDVVAWQKADWGKVARELDY